MINHVATPNNDLKRVKILIMCPWLFLLFLGVPCFAGFPSVSIARNSTPHFALFLFTISEFPTLPIYLL